MGTLFYIKKEEDSLYFRHFLKVVYNKAEGIMVLWINLRKLKFSYIDICAIRSDDRINTGAVKTLIMKIAEEWVMINSRGF